MAPEWDGVLFLGAGLYAKGALRFRLEFPASYPAEPPLVFMADPIPNHPLVDADTGEVELVLSWYLPEQRLLGDVLLALKGLFLVELNAEALRARDSVPNESALSLYGCFGGLLFCGLLVSFALFFVGGSSLLYQTPSVSRSV